MTTAETAQTTNISGTKKEILVLGLGLDWWNGALIIALCFAALAAVGVVATTTAVVVLQKRESELAGQRVAEANAKAGLANERAANAELALAKFRAPRSLSREQRIRISTSLLAFKDITFDGGISNPDPEILSLFSSIGSAIRESGWKLISWKGGDVGFSLGSGEYLGIAPARGVIVQYSKGGSERLSQSARTLVSALTAEGIEAVVDASDAPASKNADALHILIGLKT